MCLECLLVFLMLMILNDTKKALGFMFNNNNNNNNKPFIDLKCTYYTRMAAHC